jgi:predicted nuclease of predicted toxin-antitoxin system
MKLLVDMNLSPSWKGYLRSVGIEAVHWSEIGPGNAPDSALFQWARDHDHIVFTHDLDFGAMLALTAAESPSVFQVRTEDVSPSALGDRVVALLRRFEPELNAGALLVVDELRERIRLLPLGAR